MASRHPHSSSLLLLVGMSVAVGACYATQPAPRNDAVTVEQEPDSSIGPDDVFDVRVYGEPDLSNTFRVSSDGSIDYPLVGRLQVAGMSSSQIQELLTKKLSDGYLRKPQIALMVKEWNSRRISVLGHVKNPGYVEYRANMTILDAIVAAGGFAPTADKNRVRLRQENKGHVTTSVQAVGDMSEGRAAPVRLHPRDVVVVEERLF